MPLTWIDYQGQRLLHVDFRGMTEDAMIAQLDEEAAMLKAKRGKSRLLVDVTGAPTGQRFMAAAKSRVQEVQALIDRQAIVGVDGLKSILLRAYNAVSQATPLKPFPTEQEAKDYLVR